MPNRSTRDERDAETPVERPKVGPASPEIVHREIAKRVAEREGADSRPAAASEKPYKPDPLNPANDANPTKDITVGTAVRRIRGYKQKLDDEIENQSK